MKIVVLIIILVVGISSGTFFNPNHLAVTSSTTPEIINEELNIASTTVKFNPSSSKIVPNYLMTKLSTDTSFVAPTAATGWYYDNVEHTIFTDDNNKAWTNTQGADC